MDTSLNPFARTSAREAVVAKRDAILTQRAELLDQRGEILMKLRRIDREYSDCKAAARLFDLDVDFPEDDERMRYARREMSMAIEYEERYRQQLRHAEAGIPNGVRVPRAFAGGGEALALAVGPAPSPAPSLEKRPPIRDIVLEQLQLARPEGRKAADLRDYIEKRYREVIHEKTVGMTLYRLSKDGLVHRDGHTWFFGPPQEGTGNPGGETPGLEDLMR